MENKELTFGQKLWRAINPFSWIIAYNTTRKHRQSRSVSDFAHKHKHLVVIVLDPEDDTMFMAYRDQQVYNKIKSADGVNHKVVKSVMKASKFKSHIDYLLVAFVEFFKVPLTNPAMQHFVKWLDAATYSISQRLIKLKNEDLMFPKKAGEGMLIEEKKEMAVLKPESYK